ncbi:Cof-type HAD-IIB family hydrolase [Lacticaseibacillus baoqingensis]|uniref:Cof-type HAD-IIB family hydrolase n=1 Tax=Lacticaseibacillus baoqingensis TaxID=2486013 RepID=A0ABW4E8K4_9LACO|nr:Cof-type HAD-IIB family hydrolase [Lacticaseibacillus baoqingensis]
MQNTTRGIVFFDLDSTLLNHDSQLAPTTLTALTQLQANGYLPVINTGRSPVEITAIAQQAHIDTICALNGSYIAHAGQPVYQAAIKTATIAKLVAQTQALGDALAFYTGDAIMATEASAQVAAAYHFIHTPVPPAAPDYYRDHQVVMLIIFTTTNDAVYQRAYPELTLYRNTPYSIDTVAKGNSKQTGMAKLQTALGLTGVPTYAFGDGTNDVPMLQAADHAVAMANGIPAAKAAAKFVTADNDHDGIAIGLKKLGLI